jgi:hypothetical protein
MPKLATKRRSARGDSARLPETYDVRLPDWRNDIAQSATDVLNSTIAQPKSKNTEK